MWVVGGCMERVARCTIACMKREQGGCDPGAVVDSIRSDLYSPLGFSRDCPFGCIHQGLLSILYFLPGQCMRPHRHLDSDEYFTAARGDAEMYVNGRIVALPQGHTFLRRRGVLHAIRNAGEEQLVVQSFQSPIPREEKIRWESAPEWGAGQPEACPRCWCGQEEDGRCANCAAPLASIRNRRSGSAV